MRKFDTYKFILYPLLLVSLIIYSAFQVGLDLNRIMTTQFWFSVFFKYILQLAWIYFGIPDGKKKGANDKDYVEAKGLLVKAITLIKDKGLLTVFGLYVKSNFEKQREQYIKDVCFANGIPEEVYNLPLRTIKVKLDDYSLTIWHYKLIKKLKHGDFYFPYLDAQTYLSAYDIKNRIQMALYNEKNTILHQLFPKMMMTLLLSIAFNSAVIGGDVDGLQAISDGVFNVLISLLSYGFAFTLGVEIMNDYAKVYDIRRNYISKFIEAHNNGSLVKELRIYEVAEVVK